MDVCFWAAVTRGHRFIPAIGFADMLLWRIQNARRSPLLIRPHRFGSRLSHMEPSFSFRAT